MASSRNLFEEDRSIRAALLIVACNFYDSAKYQSRLRTGFSVDTATPEPNKFFAYKLNIRTQQLLQVDTVDIYHLCDSYRLYTPDDARTAFITLQERKEISASIYHYPATRLYHRDVPDEHPHDRFEMVTPDGRQWT
jgi:hypothetical protein